MFKSQEYLPGWLGPNLFSVYYPIIMSGFSLIICFWAEVYVSFNILAYSTVYSLPLLLLLLLLLHPFILLLLLFLLFLAFHSLLLLHAALQLTPPGFHHTANFSPLALADSVLS